MSSLVDRVVAIRDGRTSTEIRRRRSKDDGTVQEEEEWVILDQAGRLQLPASYVEALERSMRVKVKLEPDHVSVWPGWGGNGQGRSTPEEPWANGLSCGASAKAEAQFAVVTSELGRTFELGVEEIHAVQNVSLRIPSGTLAVVIGRSGSGKTTLLNLIAGLDEPTSGAVSIDDRWLADLSRQERIDLRRKQIGFVYQTFGLLPFLSVRENVEVPLRLLHTSRKERETATTEVLEWVGLSGRAKHRVYELSGGSSSG